MRTLCTALGLALLVPSTAIAASPASLVPSGADLVIHMDIKGLLGSPLYKKHGAAIMASREAGEAKAEMKSKLGLDLEKDVHSITIGMSGDLAANPHFTAVIQGKFDVAKFTAEARKDGDLVESKVAGLTSFGRKNPTREADKLRMGFLNATTMLVSSEVEFGKLVSTAQGKGKHMGSSKLGKFLSTGKDQFKMAFTVSDAHRAMIPDDPQSAMMKKIDTVTFGAGLTRDLTFAMIAAMQDAEAATGINALMRAGLMAAKAQMSDAPPVIKRLVEAVTINAEGKSVVVNAKAKGADIDELVKMAPGGGAATRSTPPGRTTPAKRSGTK